MFPSLSDEARRLDRKRFEWLLASLLALALSSCKTDTGIVRRGAHIPASEEAPTRVSRPPPPARVEVLPLRRNEDCYYKDGHWTPKGGSWSWTKGAWILPPPGCYYAPPRTRYENLEVGTTLVYRAGAWHSYTSKWIQNGPSCEDPQPCPAANAKHSSDEHEAQKPVAKTDSK